jgi:WD40 repeat protein/tRNA A-37 threonylcarbamoyl transferase component Bud32
MSIDHQPDDATSTDERRPTRSEGAWAEATVEADRDRTAAGDGDATQTADAAVVPFQAGGDPAATGFPRVFGDYLLLGEIARGGMGVVYRAEQGRLKKRPVALKMIRDADLATLADLRRFRMDAEAIAQLEHPHIVPIYELGQIDGQPFFSMRLIEGGHLGTHAARLKADPRATAALMAKVAHAVHFAHQRAILHRDLKPSNILVDERGEPFVTDFGLAKRIDAAGASQATVPGAIMGTPAYMAPEQARGETSALTVRTDVYGLGATLYEVLTGQAPFVGTIPEILRQVEDREPAPPRGLNPALDRDLEAICLKALEKKAKDRYGSAEELAEDLERWLRREPTKARPVRPWERAAKWARRRPAIATLVGFVAMALIGFVGTVLWFNIELGRAVRIARSNAYNADVNSVRRAIEAGDIHAALAGLDRLDPAMRGFEWPYLYRQCFHHLVRKWDSGSPVISVAVSPDGRTIATGHGREDVDHIELVPTKVMLWDLATGERRIEFTAHDGPVYEVAFSPDGKILATAGGDGFARVWDVATGERQADIGPFRHQVNGVAFRPDGKLLAIGAGERYPGKVGTARVGPTWERPGEVAAWDLTSRSIVWRHETSSGATLRVLFAPNGSDLVCTQHMGLQIRDPETGTERRPHSGIGGMGVAFSADSRRLFGSSRHVSSMDLWEVRDGRVTSIAVEHRTVRLNGMGMATALALAPPREHQIAVTFGVKNLERYDNLRERGHRRFVRYWDLRHAVPLYLLVHQEGVRGLAFTRDGHQLISVDQAGVICVWRTIVDRPNAVEKTFPGEPRSLAFSAPGGRLAVGCDDGSVHLSGPEAEWAVLRGPEGSVQTLAFAPDGRLLAIGTDEGGLQVWDTATKRPAFPVWTDHSGPIRAAAFRGDGRMLASVGADGQVRLWDPIAGKRGKVLSDDPVTVSGLAFDRDGFLHTAGGDGVVRVWDPERGRLARSWRAHATLVRALAISDDGRLVATAGTDEDRAVKLWDARGHLRQSIEQAQDVLTMTFADLGRVRLVTGGRDRLVRAWDTESGQQVLDLPGHDGPIGAMAFDRVGGRLVTAGGPDRMVRIWETAEPPAVARYTKDKLIDWAAGWKNANDAVKGPPGPR